jgi:hypothetical protein
MSKRRNKPTSIKMLVVIWLATLLGGGLVYVFANALVSTLKTFRSCDSNSAGLMVSACGKQGLNVGDTILLGLFVASVALFVSLCTAAIRMSRRNNE